MASRHINSIGLCLLLSALLQKNYYMSMSVSFTVLLIEDLIQGVILYGIYEISLIALKNEHYSVLQLRRGNSVFFRDNCPYFSIRTYFVTLIRSLSPRRF